MFRTKNNVNKAINHMKKRIHIVANWNEDHTIKDDFTECEEQLLIHKARHLVAAHETALVRMPLGKAWMGCCESAVEAMKGGGA